MLAAQLGKVELMQVLLQLQVLDDFGEGNGQQAVIPDLIQQPDGFSALFHAVSCPNEPRGCEAIHLLAKHGADVNQKNARNGEMNYQAYIIFVQPLSVGSACRARKGVVHTSHRAVLLVFVTVCGMQVVRR